MAITLVRLNRADKRAFRASAKTTTARLTLQRLNVSEQFRIVDCCWLDTDSPGGLASDGSVVLVLLLRHTSNAECMLVTRIINPHSHLRTSTEGSFAFRALPNSTHSLLPIPGAIAGVLCLSSSGATLCFPSGAALHIDVPAVASGSILRHTFDHAARLSLTTDVVVCTEAGQLRVLHISSSKALAGGSSNVSATAQGIRHSATVSSSSLDLRCTSTRLVALPTSSHSFVLCTMPRSGPLELALWSRAGFSGLVLDDTAVHGPFALITDATVLDSRGTSLLVGGGSAVQVLSWSLATSEPHSSMPLHGAVPRLLPLANSCTDEYARYLVFSYPGSRSSLALDVSTPDVQQCSIPGLAHDEATVAFWPLATSGSLVQVTTHHVYLIRNGTRVASWRGQSSQPIAHAQACRAPKDAVFVALAVQAELTVLHVAADIQVLDQKRFSHAISAVALHTTTISQRPPARGHQPRRKKVRLSQHLVASSSAARPRRTSARWKRELHVFVAEWQTNQVTRLTRDVESSEPLAASGPPLSLGASFHAHSLFFFADGQERTLLAGSAHGLVAVVNANKALRLVDTLRVGSSAVSLFAFQPERDLNAVLAPGARAKSLASLRSSPTKSDILSPLTSQTYVLATTATGEAAVLSEDERSPQFMLGAALSLPDGAIASWPVPLGFLGSHTLAVATSADELHFVTVSNTMRVHTTSHVYPAGWVSQRVAQMSQGDSCVVLAASPDKQRARLELRSTRSLALTGRPLEFGQDCRVIDVGVVGAEFVIVVCSKVDAGSETPHVLLFRQAADAFELDDSREVASLLPGPLLNHDSALASCPAGAVLTVGQNMCVLRVVQARTGARGRLEPTPARTTHSRCLVTALSCAPDMSEFATLEFDHCSSVCLYRSGGAASPITCVALGAAGNKTVAALCAAGRGLVAWAIHAPPQLVLTRAPAQPTADPVALTTVLTLPLASQAVPARIIPALWNHTVPSSVTDDNTTQLTLLSSDGSARVVTWSPQ